MLVEGEPSGPEEVQKAAHIYPTWVSEGTCSTKCVDIRGEEEFCVAPATCDLATWSKNLEKHILKEQSLHNLKADQSHTACNVWGETNMCDGILCSQDHEC